MLDAALKQAIKGRDKKHMRYSHGAAVYHGDKLVCVAHNRPLRHGKYSIHAEESVLRKIIKNLNRRKLVMVVVRVNNFGQLRNSKPCKRCEILIRSCGIRRVIYSTDNDICEMILS